MLGIELRKGRSDARARCVNVNTTDATTGATEHTVTARSVRVQRLFGRDDMGVSRTDRFTRVCNGRDRDLTSEIE